MVAEVHRFQKENKKAKRELEIDLFSVEKIFRPENKIFNAVVGVFFLFLKLLMPRRR